MNLVPLKKICKNIQTSASACCDVPTAPPPLGEPDADWKLIDVEDVCIVVLGVWIVNDGGAVVNDAAGTVLLEKADHAGTSGLNVFIRGCR